MEPKEILLPFTKFPAYCPEFSSAGIGVTAPLQNDKASLLYK
jgi:hypothetical protein